MQHWAGVGYDYDGLLLGLEAAHDDGGGVFTHWHGREFELSAVTGILSLLPIRIVSLERDRSTLDRTMLRIMHNTPYVSKDCGAYDRCYR